MKTTITLTLLPCANNIIACLQFSWVFVIKSELSVNITVYIVWSYRNWPWMILKVITGASLIAVQWQEKICYLEWTGYWMTLLQESSLPTEQEGKTKPEMDLKEVSIKIFQPFLIRWTYKSTLTTAFTDWIHIVWIYYKACLQSIQYSNLSSGRAQV